MRKISFLLAAMALASPAWAAPPEVASTIHAPSPYGEGRVRLLFITAYTADLWTDAQPWSMEAPFAFTIQYGIGFDTDDLVSRTISEMKHVDPALGDTVLAKWKPQLEKVFPPVKSGDRITALRLPGKPVVFYRNGSETGSIAGDDFAKDFFGIWLSPQTSDPDLRGKLLKLK